MGRICIMNIHIVGRQQMLSARCLDVRFAAEDINI